MSAAKPQLQVQSRVNGLLIALPNHSNISGLAKHFNTRGDNELVFAEVKTSGRQRRPKDGDKMQIGSPAEEGTDNAGKPRGRRAAPAGSDLA